MNTEKQLQFVTHEQAGLLRELHFDWECNIYYTNINIDIPPWEREQAEMHFGFNKNNRKDYSTCSVPTVALALKWLRDVQKIFSCVDFSITSFHKGYYWRYFSFDNKDFCNKTKKLFGSYEAAESALLDEILIQILIL